jgi:hypothetical protein
MISIPIFIFFKGNGLITNGMEKVMIRGMMEDIIMGNNIVIDLS